VVGFAPRAPEEIVRPRRLAGVVARPLNFTVRRHENASVRLDPACLFADCSKCGKRSACANATRGV
jgi:hypothetical protein